MMHESFQAFPAELAHKRHNRAYFTLKTFECLYNKYATLRTC